MANKISKQEVKSWLQKRADIKPMTVKHHPGNSHEIYDSTFPLTSLPYLDRKDNEARIDMHGGGTKGHYMLANNQDASEGSVEVPLMGTMQWGEHGFPETIKDLQNNKDIDKVFSTACNLDGGGRPEFYEKLLNHDLKEVTMTPPGYYGVAGQQMTNGPGYLLNTLLDAVGDKGGRGAPQHTYEKHESWMPFGIGDKWEDKGEHSTSFDHAVTHYGPGIAGGLGMAGLAYALYHKMKNKKKLETTKNHVLHHAKPHK